MQMPLQCLFFPIRHLHTTVALAKCAAMTTHFCTDKIEHSYVINTFDCSMASDIRRASARESTSYTVPHDNTFIHHPTQRWSVPPNAKWKRMDSSG